MEIYCKSLKAEVFLLKGTSPELGTVPCHTVDFYNVSAARINCSHAKLALAFALTFCQLPTAGHQSSLCFCGCFLEYVFSTPWASATLVTSSDLLVTVLGLQEITATHSGCGLLVSRDKLSSCYSWLQPQTATTTLGTPGKFFSRKLTWSTRLQTRVVMGTTNPFSSHSFRKIKAKQVCCGQTSRGHCLLVFEKLPSYRAGLSGQGVTDQLQGWGRESFE